MLIKTSPMDCSVVNYLTRGWRTMTLVSPRSILPPMVVFLEKEIMGHYSERILAVVVEAEEEVVVLTTMTISHELWKAKCRAMPSPALLANRPSIRMPWRLEDPSNLQKQN
jgi:hypothetical protein